MIQQTNTTCAPERAHPPNIRISILLIRKPKRDERKTRDSRVCYQSRKIERVSRSSKRGPRITDTDGKTLPSASRRSAKRAYNPTVHNTQRTNTDTRRKEKKDNERGDATFVSRVYEPANIKSIKT